MDGLIALALAKKNIKGVTKSIAEEYDPTKEYTEGALTIKDGKLQKYVGGEWVETVITENIGGGDIVQSEEEYVGEVVGGTLASIDPTLSTQGAAADAKATGDAIGALIIAVDNIDGLPPVTTDDDGKVLGVVDGEWSSINLGSVFKLKGSVATVDNLPTTGNEIGDVYYVIAASVGYIWLNDGTENRWEQLGLAIDLSQYATTQYVDQKIGEIESILETI